MVNYEMVKIELKYLKEAISHIPDAFSPDSTPSLDLDNILAISYDFLKYQLEYDTRLKNFKKALNRLSKKHRQILLIEIGALSNDDVLPRVKDAIKKGKITDFLVINKLTEIAKSLADIVPPQNIIIDPERGEEIARKLAKELQIDIAGETPQESESRLLQVDSLELQNVKQQIEAKIRKALEEARRKAKAAAKVTRE